MGDNLLEPAAAVAQPRALFPSWAISLVLHGSLLAALIAWMPAPPRGAGSESSHTVGLIIRQDGAGDDQYYPGSDPNAAPDAIESAGGSRVEQAVYEEPFVAPAESEPRALEPMDARPYGDELLAAQSLTSPSEPAELDTEQTGEQAAEDTAADAAETSDADSTIGIESAIDAAKERLSGGQSLGRGRGLNEAFSRGKASTKVFGLPGEGYKFVYVFDRSASMGGSGRSTLAAAKRELIKSLESLGETHQFQIIFYNEHPVVLDIAGPNKLVFGTKQNKELARRFVAGVTADGATRHEEALHLALRLKPDVIFFLTDADEPALTNAQLRRVQTLCEGVTSINTIEFGLGPAVGGENFLSRLARENSGRYAYFDISGAGPGE